MLDGFVKVAATSPQIKVADYSFNKEAMLEKARELAEQGVKLILFPEFSLTGYTSGDLFLQDSLIEGALEKLHEFENDTKEYDSIFVIGLPIEYNCKLFNVAAVLYKGKIYGLVPKTNVPMYSEFYEGRQFLPWKGENVKFKMPWGEETILGYKNIFKVPQVKNFTFAIEICEDLWVPQPPSARHAMAGANIILNLSASDELTGKAYYRRDLVKNQSARTLSAYIYANAGEGESTQDMVFSGHNLIVENGRILKEAKPFAKNHDIISEIDLGRLHSERRRMTTFPITFDLEKEGYQVTNIDFKKIEKTNLTREIERTPFVPIADKDRDERCSEILDIQANGLAKRLRHTNCKDAIIGLSGGLDSTLALIVTVRAFDLVGIDRKNIHAITMPCFGTTDRTYNNAKDLAKALNASLEEIDIKDAVNLHFKDINHDSSIHDITYENSQARERTQILMDLANKYNGMVIGTGDMSELALGWATYNGDHMSMYGVNVSIPKTLVKYLVRYFMETCQNELLEKVLGDILATPVSPELLPPKENGKISQKTEDIVGPYELHDFFMYYTLRLGYDAGKILRLAQYAFLGEYDGEEIKKWLKVFMRRFFSQQFKRSCLPDGPKVGTVSVSPRGDLRMPSDASSLGFFRGL